MQKSDRFSGNPFFFRKPGLIRLEYVKPSGQLLVADGEHWWFYMPQQEMPQVYKMPMESGGGDAPVYILGGRMAERFTGKLVGTEPRGGAECYVLDLEPRSKIAYYRSLRAWVDRLTFATRAIRYIDETGNFNTFDLGDATADVILDAGLFSFTPPADAQILEADSPNGNAGP